jgi:hypothetical protein
MKNLSYVLGFITGLILVAVIGFVIGIIAKKKNQSPKIYDERQQLLRGKAYKQAFWVLVAYLGVGGIFNLLTGIEWADLATNTTIGIFLSLTVFIIACIKNDAYFQVNQNRKFFYWILTIGIAVNLFGGILLLTSEDVQLITNGMLNFHVLNFTIVIMLLIVLAALIAKSASEKKSLDGSES